MGALIRELIDHYEGKQYVMKQTEINRWFDER